MEKNLPQRKNIRLKNYNYATLGMYFITICIQDRIEILGKIRDKKIKLTEQGIIAQNYLESIEVVYDGIKIDEYIIMPNHIHMIIEINSQTGISVPRIIKQYKEIVTKQIGYSIWQKSYYEHVIRNEKEYYKIKQYIQNNVINWEEDKYFLKFLRRTGEHCSPLHD